MRMTKSPQCELFVDGASRGNPGPAGIGIFLRDPQSGKTRGWCQYLGETTNNVAEYTALLRALEQARTHGCDSIIVRTDSQLLARQISGQYRVRQPHLIPLHEQARSLMRLFFDCKVVHIPREQNKQADKLANRGIDVRAEQLAEVLIEL